VQAELSTRTIFDLLKIAAMKNISILFVLLPVFLLSGCSKDVLKRYDDRIVGSWRVADVKRYGIGGSVSRLPFNGGTFNFNPDGTLTYVSEANISYKGRWDIEKVIREDNMVHRLQVSAVDFTTQEILSQYYDDMNFIGTNRFNASINLSYNTYVTQFRR
jgi:hypothetical protein